MIGMIGGILGIIATVYLIVEKIRAGQKEEDALKAVNNLQNNHLEHIKERLAKIESQGEINEKNIAKLYTKVEAMDRVCQERHK